MRKFLFSFRCVAFWAAGLLIATSASGQASDQSEIAFVLMFGNDVRAAQVTETADDDAALAERFLAAADSGRNAEGLTTRLYEKTYSFGILAPVGYEPASKALDKLVEREPQRKAEWNEKRLALFEIWYENEGDKRIDPEEVIDLYMRLADAAVKALDADAAEDYLRRVDDFARKSRSERRDEIRDSLADLVRLRKVLAKIEAAEAKLATDPAAADELAMLYLVELDAPKKAAAYAPQVQDPKLKQHLQHAATPYADLEMNAAFELAQFYLTLAEANDSANPVAMLVRSMVWYSEYLSREPVGTDKIKQAIASLEAIGDGLSKKGIGRKLARKMASRIRGDGLFDRPDDVQQAIDKGVAWLYAQRDPEKHWEQEQEGNHKWGGYTALAVYALLMADEDPRTNRDLYRATNWLMNCEMHGTYPLCFRVHAWEMLPQRDRFRRVMAQDVARLRGGMTREGFWDYSINSRWRKEKGDLSTTLAGGLGIWIGEESGGLAVPGGQWDKIAKALIEYQNADGGWTYNVKNQAASFGSMSAAGLTLLYAARPHVAENLKPEIDAAIVKALGWMDLNFSPTRNVNRGSWKNYYLAAVQHAGIFGNRKEFKDMDWYQTAADHLVRSQQQDGSWSNMPETAFAIAFLCRGGIQFDYEKLESDAAATPIAD